MVLCVYILQMHGLGVVDGGFVMGIFSHVGILTNIRNISLCLSLSRHHANWLVGYKRGGFVVYDFISFPNDEQQSCGADE